MFNLKPIAFVSGTVICAVGFFLFIPLITELIFKTDTWESYAVPILIYLIVGGSLVITNRNIEFNISIKDAYLITVLSWLLMSIVCAVPFMYSETNMTLVDALFESMSGVTTTGATTLSNIENSPKGILIWRAFLQWLGGIGIVIIALFVLPFLRVGGMQLFHMEGDDPYDKALPKISSVIKKIFLIYFVFTIILIFLYHIFGMLWFDSVAHAFTTISTGGFSNYDESFGFFESNEIYLITIIFMILGSLPFLVLVKISHKNLFPIFKDNQIKLFIFVLIISIFLIFYFAHTYIDGNFIDKIISVSFNTISIISGTGFTSENFENWGNYASVLFLILMFIGGCAGSTTGGLKIFRFLILFKYLNIHLIKMLKPHKIISSQFNGKKINDSTYESVLSFFFIYIITFFVSSLLLSFGGLDFITCISASASAISNVGPGLGDIIGPDGNYGILSDYSKIILIFTMFLGRLEMLTIIIVLLPSFWKNS